MNTPETTEQPTPAVASSALLADALRDVLKLIEDQILVRNTDNDADIRAFLQQGMRLTSALKAAQDALKSANSTALATTPAPTNNDHGNKQ